MLGWYGTGWYGMVMLGVTRITVFYALVDWVPGPVNVYSLRHRSHGP